VPCDSELILGRRNHMKYTKSILMGTGGFLLAGLTLTLLAPKAAHAVVATLVQVANTSSSPVFVSSVTDPGAGSVSKHFVPEVCDYYRGGV
jgi:hypothetical protein